MSYHLVQVQFSNLSYKKCQFLQRFFTSTMYSSGSSSSRIHNITSEFTEHAAVDILKNAPKFGLLRNDHAIRPLLNELNDKGYIKIKQMVHKTFPDVSTTTIYQWQYRVQQIELIFGITFFLIKIKFFFIYIYNL